MKKGPLRDRIRIERPVADDSFAGAGSGTWQQVAEAWAEVQDVLPSRGERVASGINMATRPARVRMSHRTDITPDMRFLLLRRRAGEWIVERVMQIIAGPATIRQPYGVEFMVEDYSTAGNPA